MKHINTLILLIVLESSILETTSDYSSASDSIEGRSSDSSEEYYVEFRKTENCNEVWVSTAPNKTRTSTTIERTTFKITHKTKNPSQDKNPVSHNGTKFEATRNPTKRGNHTTHTTKKTKSHRTKSTKTYTQKLSSAALQNDSNGNNKEANTTTVTVTTHSYTTDSSATEDTVTVTSHTPCTKPSPIGGLGSPKVGLTGRNKTANGINDTAVISQTHSTDIPQIKVTENTASYEAKTSDTTKAAVVPSHTLSSKPHSSRIPQVEDIEDTDNHESDSDDIKDAVVTSHTLCSKPHSINTKNTVVYQKYTPIYENTQSSRKEVAQIYTPTRSDFSNVYTPMDDSNKRASRYVVHFETQRGEYANVYTPRVHNRPRLGIYHQSRLPMFRGPQYYKKPPYAVTSHTTNSLEQRTTQSTKRPGKSCVTYCARRCYYTIVELYCEQGYHCCLF